MRISTKSTLLLAALASLPYIGMAQTVEVTPFSETFDTQAGFDRFTVVDSNNDGYKWLWGSTNKMASFHSSLTNAGDDWLMTPPIAMKADRNYVISFKMKIGNTDWPEKFSAAFGQGDDPAKFTTIVEQQTLTSIYASSYERTVHPTSDGNYRFAIHAESDAKSFYLYADDISVVDGPLLTAPDSVTNFTVEPGEEGAMKAYINFTTPTKAVNGSPISSLTKVVVYNHKGVAIDSIMNPELGKAYSFTDKNPAIKYDFNNYSVVAFNENGAGTRATKRAFIGTDAPLAPENVTLVDNGDGSLTVSWDNPPTVGKNGGYVDLDDIYYSISDTDNGSIIEYEAYESPYTISDYYDLTGTQRTIGVTVEATDYSDFSDGYSNRIVIGDAYKLPFHDSFAMGNSDNLWWGQSRTQFRLTKGESQDGDRGAAVFQPKTPRSTDFNSGKISLKGATKPVLSFWYLEKPGEDIQFSVDINKATKDIVNKGSYDFKSLTGEGGWKKAIFDLADVADADYIVAQISATNNSSEPLIIDNFNVIDQKDKDLSATLKANDFATVGKPSTATVQVTNFGATDADDYSVELYVNGKKVATESGPALSSFDHADIVFNYVPDVALTDTFALSAKVVYEDNDETNNTTDTIDVRVVETDLPTVSNLTATAADSGANLTWTPADLSQTTVTDDFESYKPFIIDGIGPWKVVDGDELPTVDIQNYNGYPHASGAIAYQVFNPLLAGIDTADVRLQAIKPHSGGQMLACFGAVGETSDLMSIPNDDWLISPELSGNKQTVSIWARSLDAYDFGEESFVFLTSSEGNDVSDFTTEVKPVLPSLNTRAVPDEWTNYVFEVPEGTKYFAVHEITVDKYILLIDDITYEKATPQVAGYNIYRDGELVATVDDAAATTYNDTAASNGKHEYSVAVVYDKGISRKSNNAEVTVATGITSVNANADGVLDGNSPRYNLSGQRVGKDYRGIVIINGRKVLQK